MKRILISAVLALALAGTTAFAAQNKNTGKTKPAASKPATGGNMSAPKGKTKHRRHHRRGTKTSNSNTGGSMTKTKTKNKNSK